MADPLQTPLQTLMDRFPMVKGVAFTDLDGEDIALMPRSARETLRLCAAYNGIALRRLTTAEGKDGKGAIQHLVVRGETGTVLSLKVGEGYQLVVRVEGLAPTGGVLSAARVAAKDLEAQI